MDEEQRTKAEALGWYLANDNPDYGGRWWGHADGHLMREKFVPGMIELQEERNSGT